MVVAVVVVVVVVAVHGWRLPPPGYCGGGSCHHATMQCKAIEQCPKPHCIFIGTNDWLPRVVPHKCSPPYKSGSAGMFFKRASKQGSAGGSAEGSAERFRETAASPMFLLLLLLLLLVLLWLVVVVAASLSRLLLLVSCIFFWCPSSLQVSCVHFPGVLAPSWCPVCLFLVY